MILADTSVWVALWRTPTARLFKIIHDYDAAICGVSVSEVYAGARSIAEYPRSATLIGVFQQALIPETMWLELGMNINKLRLNGVTVPIPDALIATVAMQGGLESGLTTIIFH